MTTYPWKDLLTQWSQEIIESGEYDAEYPPEVLKAGWLGYPGASEAEIAAAEERLNISFPPSFRQFLQISNGWRATTLSIDNIRSTEDIAWLREGYQDLINAWQEFNQQTSPDEDIIVYDEGEDTPDFDPTHLESTLAISEYGDGIYLLNPNVVTPDGEWEAWFFADWIPGAHCYPSFWELMQAEHQNFLESLEEETPLASPLSLPGLTMNPSDLTGLLGGAMPQSDMEAKMNALLGLDTVSEDQSFEELLAIFQDSTKSLFIREQAARTLGKLGDPRAVVPLIEALGKNYEDAGSMKVSTLLGDMGNLPGGNILQQMMGNMTIDDILGQAQGMFGGMLGGQSSDLLTPGKVSQGFSEHFNKAIQEGLLELGDIALPALFESLDNPDPDVRYHVALTLTQSENEEAICEQFTKHTEDPDPKVQEVINTYLGQFVDSDEEES